MEIIVLSLGPIRSLRGKEEDDTGGHRVHLQHLSQITGGGGSFPLAYLHVLIPGPLPASSQALRY